MSQKFCRLVAAGLLGLLSTCIARADTYPSRPVTIVVPYPPGGSSDLSARLLAKQLSDQTNVNYIVEDKAGGSGVLGAQYVSASKPDGYTLLYGGPALAIAPYMIKDVGIDLQKDITPITLVTATPYVLLINPKLPAKSPQELVAWIKQNPNQYKWGSSGFGSTDDVGTELFDKQAGISPLIVPYSGGGPEMVAAVSGEIDGLMEPASAAKSYMQSGQLRALGVTSTDPVEILPGLATVASQGFPGYQLTVWYGMWGPKGMPADLTALIHDQIVKAMTDPALVKAMAATGVELKSSPSPADFGTFFKSESDKYGSIVKNLKQ